MPINHKLPSKTIVKELYGTAFQCAFPACRQPLYRLSEDGQSHSLNSRISHIAARSENGPRWNADMSAADNAAKGNLLLMCLSHASEIDDMARLDEFTTDLLHRWKQEQLALCDRIGQKWDLTDAEADCVIDQSFGVTIHAGVIDLGGKGGGPGGGGGGGGVWGNKGRAGDGGPAGSITVHGCGLDELGLDGLDLPEGIFPVKPAVADGPALPPGTVLVQGRDGEAPGGGGGGAGAVLPGSRPWPPSEEPLGTLGHAHVPGFDGLPGGDTTFGDANGPLLVAPGGVGSLAGSGLRSVSAAMRLNAALLVRHAEVAGGLSYLSGTGCCRYELPNVPTTFGLGLFLFFEAPLVTVGEYTVLIHAVGPNGNRSLVQKFPVVIEKSGDIVQCALPTSVPVTIDSYGLWALQISTEAALIGQVRFIVVRTGSEPAPKAE